MKYTLSSSRNAFSTIVALGVIGFLLVLVSGLVTVFMREVKITRAVYDGILTYAGAEGSFEYAMLKIANHREGFSDRVTEEDPEYRMLSGTITRTKNLAIEYMIKAQSDDTSGKIAPTSHLIIPLFVGTGDKIGKYSIDPHIDPAIEITKNITLRLDGSVKLGWNILARNKETGETIGIVGSGSLNGSTIGNNRTLQADCYDKSGNKTSCESLTAEDLDPDGTGQRGQKIEYMVENPISVNDFLGNGSLSDFYLIVFNHTTTPVSYELTADSPFTLPMTEVEVRSYMPGRASQTIRFTENKSRLFESIFYGMFSN